MRKILHLDAGDPAHARNGFKPTVGVTLEGYFVIPQVERITRSEGVAGGDHSPAKTRVVRACSCLPAECIRVPNQAPCPLRLIPIEKAKNGAGIVRNGGRVTLLNEDVTVGDMCGDQLSEINSPSAY